MHRLSDRVLLAAGLVNIIGILVFSLGYTNSVLINASPIVFSRFGIVSIILWGLAYLAVIPASNRSGILWVFALEKAVYVATWATWMLSYASSLGNVFAQSPLTGTFYLLYGPIDLGFGILFALIAAGVVR